MSRNQLVKFSAFAGVMSSMAILQTYAFSLLNLSSVQKFTVYRLEMGLIANAIFTPGVRFAWKRIMKDLLDDTSPTIQICFKFLVAILIGLAYLCPFTNFFIKKEPFFNVICWLAFGFFMVLLFYFGMLKLLVTLCKPYGNILDFSNHRVTSFGLIFSIITIWIGYGIASSAPTVIRVEVPVPKLPQAMDKLRIVLLSDIHLGPTVGIRTLNRIVEMTNDLQPDIVLIAGDLTDVSVAKAEFMSSPLKYLNPPLGKYYVTGNHEYHTGDADNWFLLMKSYGFVVLHNSNKKIYSRAQKDEWFCLLGTDDYEAHRFGLQGHGMDLQKAYEGCDSKHANILVTHQPRAAKLALDSELSIQLVLSGHTHAGQIFPLSIPVYFLNPFFHGLYKYKESHVYVSQGCAYYGFPLRLFSHPEITEVMLRAA